MAFDAQGNRDEHRATIGPSVSVKGEITGEEDILIEGSVEGQINLKKNSVTVAKTGRVKANVFGVVIRVEGEVVGDITGAEKVIVLSSGRVVGNISAPRISLEEGGRVKGMIDTESNATEYRAGETRSTAKVEEAVEGAGKKAGLFGQMRETKANSAAAPVTTQS